MPEGPAAPSVCRAADLIQLASNESKITGWTGGGSSLTIESESAGKSPGCLSDRISLTEVNFQIQSDHPAVWGYPVDLSVRSRRAALVFP